MQTETHMEQTTAQFDTVAEQLNNLTADLKEGLISGEQLVIGLTGDLQTAVNLTAAEVAKHTGQLNSLADVAGQTAAKVPALELAAVTFAANITGLANLVSLPI